ncbi:hypothetical protein E4T56_gene2764 [Termitomyces sp. T112]|nr:hypothetical protein E4T56_gene2764 [Termitomyces sp. T112]
MIFQTSSHDANNQDNASAHCCQNILEMTGEGMESLPDLPIRTSDPGEYMCGSEKGTPSIFPYHMLWGPPPSTHLMGVPPSLWAAPCYLCTLPQNSNPKSSPCALQAAAPPPTPHSTPAPLPHRPCANSMRSDTSCALSDMCSPQQAQKAHYKVKSAQTCHNGLEYSLGPPLDTIPRLGDPALVPPPPQTFLGLPSPEEPAMPLA